MQITTSQKRRVAIFFLTGVALFIILTALLVGNKLLKREDCYYTKFTNISVAGLAEGTVVKFQGMNIGAISDISIDEANTSVVRLDFCVKPGVPMKEGTVSQIGNVGITGLKFLELKGGGQGKKIPVHGEIPSSKSSWDTLTGQAAEISVKIENILSNISTIISKIPPESAAKIIANAESISMTMNRILTGNEGKIVNIASNAETISRDVAKTMKSITKISADVAQLTGKEGTINKTLFSVEKTAGSLRESVEEAKLGENIHKIYKLLDSVQKTMDNINLTLIKNQEDINNSFENLSEGMTNFNEFTRIIMENPSTLIKGNEGGGK